MIESIARFLGVDYLQWCALTRIALKMDFRSAARLSHNQRSEKADRFSQIFLRFGIYVFMGGMLSGLVMMSSSVFFSGLVVLSYTMVMTAMLVLVEFGAVVISPDDFAVLGHQPVSSRTFFFTRLTNVLVYTTLLSACLGLIPAVMYFFVLGFRPLLGCAAVSAILLSSITTAMFLVVVYTSILKIVHPNKLRRFVSYVQLILSFVIYGGYSILPRFIDIKSLSAISISKTIWLLAFPPSWFASYLDLAAGRTGRAEWIPALLSLVALAVISSRAGGKLALEYSDRLSAATAVSEGVKTSAQALSRPGYFFREGEARAVALLIRNQFKYDQKFRLAVLSILPLTVMYLIMGMSRGRLADPFVAHGAALGDSLLVYFAVLLFPTMLMMSLNQSDAYQASWVYYATPADRGRLVRGAKNFVSFYFVLPYLALIGAVFLYSFRNLWHVILNITVLALLSHFFLQLSVFLNPMLPFSKAPKKGQRTAGYLVTVLIGPMGAIFILYGLAIWVYPRGWLLACALILFACANALMERRLQIRVEQRTASLEYQD